MNDKLSDELVREHKGISFVGVATCFLCHDGNGNIFMAQRSKNARDEQGKWDIGGGALDWGLGAEENVRKEVQEEYSATPIEIEFLGYRDVFRQLSNTTSTHWLALDFAALVRRDDVKINEPDKFDNAGWFTLKSLPSPLHSQDISMFEANREKLARILKI